jgi:glutathione synthase/RimK-type ligase-like ATP-grasp enzyme
VETKLVGILESKNDRFVNDVVYRLNDIPVEFMTLAGEQLPVERRYRVVVDRLSFCYPFLKEIVKSLALSGTYVINNPFAALSTNKLIEIQVGSSLGISFPKTIVLPDRLIVDEAEGVVSQPYLERVAAELGLPCILKPFDGYAWEDVYVVRSIQELRDLYTSLRTRRILLAQQLISFKDYFRVFCFDKRDVLFIKWVPKPLAMGNYLHCEPGSLGDQQERLTTLTIELNQALDLDVNVVEWCVDAEGKWWMIDAFNEVPEVIPEALPADYYAWIVDRFAACIKDKLNPAKKNRTPFS